MKLTKYGHACIVLEEQGQKLVIDPGGLTPEMGDVGNVAGVVVTHNHFDHLNAEHLQAIAQASPQAHFFGSQEVAGDVQTPQIQAAEAGQTVAVGPFQLRFYGDMHALIHPDIGPHIHNVAVLVNDTFYYAGDSFTLPDGAPVKTLAAPAHAPWLKEAETIDYIAAVKPQVCIPTHNGLLSEVGQQVVNNILRGVCEKIHAEYQPLQPSESIEI